MKGAIRSAKDSLVSLAKEQNTKINLRLKEYFFKKDLTPEDFEKLLEFDFQDELNDNPPVEGTRWERHHIKFFPFSIEIDRIKKLPREEKRIALEELKDKLARQRKALAMCRVFLERCIEFNNDYPLEKLHIIVNKFQESYGFNDDQKWSFHDAISKYSNNRQKVLAARNEFQNDAELVKHITGIPVKDGTVRVSVGPMTIDIYTDTFTAGQIFDRSIEPVTTVSGFFNANGQDIPFGDGIAFTVVNTDNIKSDKATAAVLEHEHEHSKNHLVFKELFGIDGRYAKNGKWDEKNPQKDLSEEYVKYASEKDPDIKKALLESCFEVEIQYALESAKDEITAILKGNMYGEDTLSFLQDNFNGYFLNGEHNHYDYLRELRNREDQKDNPDWQELSRKILIDEYASILTKAVEAITLLIKQGKYSIQESIALLTDKPIVEWPKTVKRMLDAK